MCPRDRPDCALVTLQCLCQAMLLALDLEDLDGLVGGAGRESSAVVIENRVVLGGGGVRMQGMVGGMVLLCSAVVPYNHVIVA